MTEKERLTRVLKRLPVDRPPVICPGGMMTMACRDVMDKCGCRWPEAHREPDKMATLSTAMHDESGFENIGIPFCMTVEAEAWNGEVEDGDEVTEPSIVDYPLKELKDWRGLEDLDPERDGRLPAIAECTRRLKRSHDDVPVIGNLVGPLSLATSLIDAAPLFKALRKDPEQAHAFFGFLSRNIIRYGESLIDAGADVIVIADPSATGEILGPKLFGEYALPYLNTITDAVHEKGLPVIVHICGNLSPVYKELAALKAECLSVDSRVNIREAKESLRSVLLMGNVSTLLLQKGPAEKIRKTTSHLLACGADIIAPACGISAKTPVENLRAMSETVKTLCHE